MRIFGISQTRIFCRSCAHLIERYEKMYEFSAKNAFFTAKINLKLNYPLNMRSICAQYALNMRLMCALLYLRLMCAHCALIVRGLKCAQKIAHNERPQKSSFFCKFFKKPLKCGSLIMSAKI